MSINHRRIVVAVVSVIAIGATIGATWSQPDASAQPPSHLSVAASKPSTPITPDRHTILLAVHSAAVQRRAAAVTAWLKEAAAQEAARATAIRASATAAAQRVAQTASTGNSSATPAASTGGYGDSSPADWQMTATCEEGGRNDPTMGYFGIIPSVWASYGGLAYGPYAGSTSMANQIAIELKFQHYPPDVHGCSGGY